MACRKVSIHERETAQIRALQELDQQANDSQASKEPYMQMDGSPRRVWASLTGIGITVACRIAGDDPDRGEVSDKYSSRVIAPSTSERRTPSCPRQRTPQKQQQVRSAAGTEAPETWIGEKAGSCNLPLQDSGGGSSAPGIWIWTGQYHRGRTVRGKSSNGVRG